MSSGVNFAARWGHRSRWKRAAPVARHELRGALSPSELAEAAVLGDLALVLEVLGWFVPLVGAAFQGLGIISFAALAARQRARTALVAMLAASSVSFLVGGVGIVVQTVIVGSLGLAVGTAYRRRWNPASAVLIATVSTGIPVALISLVVEALSPGLRRLAFSQVEILWRDARAGLKFGGAGSLASSGDTTLQWAINHWWFTVPMFELLAIMLAAAICARVPVAASGAPRARLASACGSLTLAQLAGGQPFWSAGTCWHGAGAGARRAGPGLISVPGQ